MFTHKHAVAPNVDSIKRVDVDGNLVTVTLSDGTVVKHWYHVCDSCTSADTWVHQPDPDPANLTADKHRQTVNIATWDRRGDRIWHEGTSTNHVIRKDAPA